MRSWNKFTIENFIGQVGIVLVTKAQFTKYLEYIKIIRKIANTNVTHFFFFFVGIDDLLSPIMKNQSLKPKKNVLRRNVRTSIFQGAQTQMNVKRMVNELRTFLECGHHDSHRFESKY